MAYNTKLRLIDAKMEQPSGTTLTLSGNTIYHVDSNGIPKYSEHPDFTGATSAYNDPQVLVDKEYVDSKVGDEFGEMVFDSNFIVSIEEGKTFGRYVNGDEVEAAGKTPREVILMAVQEPINPEVGVSLASTGTNTSFGEENKTVNLDLEYEIKSLDAVSTSVILEWRRGTSGAWIELEIFGVGEQFSAFTYTHNIDDSANRFLATPAEYRLIVIDSQDATNLGSSTFTDNGGTNGGFRHIMQQDVAPTATPFTVTANVLNYSGGTTTQTETHLNRERGNNHSIISATINSGRPLKELVEVRLQKRIGTGGSFTTIQTYNTFTENNTELVITDFLDDGTTNSPTTQIEYRFQIDDQTGTNKTAGLVTVIFRLPFYAGSSTSSVTIGSALIATATGANGFEGATYVLSSDGNIEIDYRDGGQQTDRFIWFAIPASSTPKLGWEQIGSTTNFGNVGNPGDFINLVDVTGVNSPNGFWSGVDYRFYRTTASASGLNYRFLNTSF